MTVVAKYKNYSHYINEGWSREPKRFFVMLRRLIEQSVLPVQAKCLDVGCATGELIGYLQKHFPDFLYTGIDVFQELIEEAANKQDARFLLQDILDNSFSEQFDLITVMGVMSIFDDKELLVFWENIFKLAKPGARIYVFSPLNEYGVDALIKHRKYKNMRAGEWESGWNIFARETIEAILNQYSCEVSFDRFRIDIDIDKNEDPIRTWTMKTEASDRQLTNGLKLLVDHYMIQVRKL